MGALLNSERRTLLPLIPGLILPIDHIHYYFIALFVGVLVHEMGHSLCAGMHGLSLQYPGVFLFCYIYPGAFISIAKSDLGMLSLWQKLQFESAGVLA